MPRVINKFQQGIRREDTDQVVSAEGGLGEHRGIPFTTPEELAQQGQFRGVPMTGPGMVPDAEDMPPAKCAAKTKKGEPCRAYATKDSVFCMVHG